MNFVNRTIFTILYRYFPNNLRMAIFIMISTYHKWQQSFFFLINVGDYRACIGKRSNTFLVVFPILLQCINVRYKVICILEHQYNTLNNYYHKYLLDYTGQETGHGSTQYVNKMIWSPNNDVGHKFPLTKNRRFI